MKNYLYPAISMAIAATGFVLLNEYTAVSIPVAYGYIIIIAAMFLGLWLAKRSKDQEDN
ncbi:MAG TPA: hypothetical protein VJ953_06795 [Saprospiraceae bacterium]|nr:hypothetical protein [Saprospiraceae bacterium]